MAKIHRGEASLCWSPLVCGGSDWILWSLGCKGVRPQFEKSQMNSWWRAPGSVSGPWSECGSKFHSKHHGEVLPVQDSGAVLIWLCFCGDAWKTDIYFQLHPCFWWKPNICLQHIAETVVANVLSSKWWRWASWRGETSTSKSVFPLSEEISESNCVILYMLKEAMAIAAIEIPSTMKHFVCPDVISVDCGKAFMISLKSSRFTLIAIRLTSVVHLMIDLNGSL